MAPSPARCRPKSARALVAVLKAISDGEAAGLLLPGDLDRLSRELLVQEVVLGQVWQAGGVAHTTTRGEILPDDQTTRCGPLSAS
jgi:hypothetical protein